MRKKIKKYGGKILFLKNRKLHVLIKVIALSIILFFLIIGVSLLVLSQNPEQAALFADNVLRPLIGSRSVVFLEGKVFGAQDLINHIHQHQPAKSNYQTNIKIVTGTDYQFHLLPPDNISPYVDTKNPLEREGMWVRIANTNLYTTFIRTDPERAYSVVNLVFIPMKITGIGAVAGIKYPGGTVGKPGTGKIPDSIQKSGTLIAAFNGGFQEKDGHYGMYAYGVTYVPMIPKLATLYIYKDGQVKLIPYDGKPFSSDVLVARQNGPFLVTNGQTNKITSEGIDLWAGTASGGYITWRSGIGVTAKGDLVYAVGPSLTPTSLADALRLAGCVSAMQLDINAFWVRFILYSWHDKEHTYTSSPLTKALTDGGKAYLTGYEKDFFYLYNPAIKK